MSEPILFERRDAVGILTLNRPEVRNVVNAEMMSRWESVLDEVEADDSLRAIVLAGSDERAFSAGGDLDWFSTLTTREEAAEMSCRMTSILDRMAGSTRPVVAAVTGHAFGGGCEILTACHIRLAAEGARFAFRHAKLGLTTGWGGGTRLLQLIGPSAALPLLLTATPIDAVQACRIGLVHAVEPFPRLLSTAIELAQTIAGNNPASIAGFLEIVRSFSTDGAGVAADLERRMFLDRWCDTPFRHALQAWRSGERREISRVVS